MTTQENILERWMRGELDDEHVSSVYPDLDLKQLRTVLRKQVELDLDIKPAAEIWHNLEKTISAPPESSNNLPDRRRMIIWFILSGVVIAMSLLYWQFNKATELKATKSIQHFALIDNTQIQLSPKSAIKYDERNYENNRILKLEGQAYFDVQQEGAFSVETIGSTVKVLGTQFDIYAFNRDYIVVNCFEGRVELFSESGEKRSLAAGQSTQLHNQEFSKIKTHQLSKPIWLNYQQDYSSATLQRVHRDIARYYDVQLDVSIDDFKTFTGTLPLNNLEKALLYLSSATGAQYEYNKDSNIIQVR